MSVHMGEDRVYIIIILIGIVFCLRWIAFNLVFGVNWIMFGLTGLLSIFHDLVIFLVSGLIFLLMWMSNRRR